MRYLQFARTFNEKFPGFETDIHGLVEEDDDGKLRYFVDCVRLEDRAIVPVSTPKIAAAG